jgi:lauroyl/myristoyl acyltransferase
MIQYTEEQIKAAFWETFHESGEIWFSNSDEVNERCTNEQWEYFTENLKEKK